MTIRIGSNIAALKTLRQLDRATERGSTASERLSSGQRINRASDDAAGLAIAASLNSGARVYTQAVRNISDAMSLLTIGDGALSQLSDITTRLSELAEQGANGVYSSKQRAALDKEASALVDEYNRIVVTTKFNDRRIFEEGDATTLRIQAGFGTQEILSVSLGEDLGRAIGDGTFSRGVSGGTVNTPSAAVVIDVDGDGINDLVTASSTFGRLGIHRGNGDGTFAAMVSQTTLGGFTMQSGDINEDGRPDLLLSAGGGTVVFTMTNNGSGGFNAAVTRDVNVTGPRSGHLLDINNDGHLDIIVGDGANVSEQHVMYGDGAGNFSAVVTMPTVNQSNTFANGDLNGDGLLDLIVSTTNSAATRVYLATAGGGFNSGTNLSVQGRSQAADINGDGILDIVTAQIGGGGFRTNLGNGDGTFRSFISSNAGDVYGLMHLRDINDDGRVDIVSSTTDAVTTFLGNGDGTFGLAASYASAGVNSVHFGDLNRDGVGDIIARNGSGSSFQTFVANSTQTPRIGHLDLTTQSSSRSALDSVRQLQTKINSERASIGANMQRLTTASSNVSQRILGYREAEGRIANADSAQESANFVQSRIQQQIAASILAQAKLEPELALELLRG